LLGDIKSASTQSATHSLTPIVDQLNDEAFTHPHEESKCGAPPLSPKKPTRKPRAKKPKVMSPSLQKRRLAVNKRAVPARPNPLPKRQDINA